jgi:hypothetical protein
MRRSIAVAAMVLGVASAAAGWVVVNRGLEEKSAELELRLARYRLAAGQRAQSERLLVERRRLDASAPYYLSESGPSRAAAELQRRLKRAGDEAGGEILSVEPLPPQKDEREVAVRVRMRGDLRALEHTLYVLEGRLPLLFVKGLAVDALAQPGSLVVTLDVAGFAGRGAPAAERPLAAFPGYPALEQLQLAVERPLFAVAKGDRPLTFKAAASQELALSGVLIRAGRRMALLRQGDSPLLLRVESGERVGEWRLSEVHPDGVVLVSGARRLELDLAPR